MKRVKNFVFPFAGIAVCLLVTAFLIVLLNDVFDGDYTDYINLWNLYLENENPYLYPKNVYGPLFSLFAYPYALHQNLPVIIGVMLYGLSILVIVRRMRDSQTFSNIRYWILIVGLLINPLVMFEIMKHGTNDSIVAPLAFLSIVAVQSRVWYMSPLLLSSAVLIKLIPAIFLLPLVLIRSKRVLRIVAATIFISGIGFLIAYNVWGDLFIDRILFAVHRQSKVLSVFRYLRGYYSPLSFLPGFDHHNAWTDSLSFPLTFMGIIAVNALMHKQNFRLITRFLLTYITFLALYKVGHPQFYILFYLLFSYWFVLSYRKHMMAYRLWFLPIWIIIASGIFYMSMRNPYYRDLLGAPTFLLQIHFVYYVWMCEKKVLRSKGMHALET